MSSKLKAEEKNPHTPGPEDRRLAQLLGAFIDHAQGLAFTAADEFRPNDPYIDADAHHALDMPHHLAANLRRFSGPAS
jgi:hypothetical protein